MLIKTLRVDKISFFREKTREVKYFKIAYISDKHVFSTVDRLTTNKYYFVASGKGRTKHILG